MIYDSGWTIAHYQVGIRVESDLFGWGVVTGVHLAPGTPSVGVDFDRAHHAFKAGYGSLRVDEDTGWCCGLRALLKVDRLVPSPSPAADSYPLAVAASADFFALERTTVLSALRFWAETRRMDGIAFIGPTARVSATYGGKAYAIVANLPLTWPGPVTATTIDDAMTDPSWLSVFEAD